MDDGRLSIGQLAKRAGLPVKTIRYYDEIGVLRPSARTAAGYRRYSVADRRKLALIRSLRALGFSLDAIGAMIDRTNDAKAIIAVQLDLIETQLRALERQRAVLRAAPDDSEADFARRLELANAAALLGAAEREAQLEAYLARASAGTNASPSERARFRRMVVEDLPAELSSEQLEAWIRLSALLDDEGLLETIRRQHAPFASARISERERERFGAELLEILGAAVSAMHDGLKPADERVRALVGRWTRLFAHALGKRHDRRFLRWFLTYAEATNDPRIEQFWRDLGSLRGWPGVAPFTRAQELLCDALRDALRSGRAA